MQWLLGLVNISLSLFPSLTPHTHSTLIPTLADYSPQTLFQYLEGVKGSVEVRRGFVQDVIKEATKFKRKPLIQQLEEWVERLPSFKAGAGAGSLKVKSRTEKRL